VLGLAALAASLSRPTRNNDNPAPTTTSVLPELSPEPAAQGPEQVRFVEGGKRESKDLEPGRAAIVTVEVKSPGQVDLAGLGLTAAAEPLTPARFDVRTGDTGSHEVRFSPAAGESSVIGVLKITESPG
jgi:hypothetical protein